MRQTRSRLRSNGCVVMLVGGEVMSTARQYVADNKAAYERLAGVVFVDAIPKNPSGKLLRRVLRDRARAMVRARL